MTDFKSWLQSKTLWSILVMLAPMISKFCGFDFGATLNDILTIAGASGAIYGRATAKQQLSKPKFLGIFKKKA